MIMESGRGMENTYVNLLKELQEKRIIAFGCGKYFTTFQQCYPLFNEKIDFILDNNFKGEMYRYGGLSIPVMRPAEVGGKDLSGHMVIFCAAKWRKMKEQLDRITSSAYAYFHFPIEVDYRKEKELGIRHRIIVPALDRLSEYSVMDKALELSGTKSAYELSACLQKRKAHTIPRITVVLTPKCSLRCKECNNLMWKFNDCGDLSADKIKASLKNILNAVDFIPCVELIGGEPFAAHNLTGVLDFLLAQEKVLAVEITTNATIIPSKEVLKRIAYSKVTVHASNYGNVINQDRFMECMKENNIRFSILGFADKWTATGGIGKRGRDSSELIRQYYQCGSGYLCKTLWEDRLYPCARAASLAVLQIMDDCPYIDCSKLEGLADRLYSFYTVPSCGPCDYCNAALENPVYVEPAEQLGREV